MTFTVARRPGAWTDGVWTPGTPSGYTIKASRPQPVGPELLQMLPEGARSSARFVVYAADDQPDIHLIDDETEELAADIVAYDSWGYLATTIDNWADRPLGYKAYILLAYGPDERA
jgi:hypothetical protein